ncbi:MAG: hypothetical protein MJ193_01195 [Clostridia bacterium]|nr:hypothetical protein [Clostridia bacterium]
MQEERIQIIRTTKDLISAIEEGLPLNPDERRKESPEDSILNYERLLDEQRILNSTKDTEDFNPSKIAYLQRVKDDYETFLEMGDGQRMRARFTEAYNRLSNGEILFKSQPTFDQGIDGKRQIINYLNDIECVGTDAFVELYGSKKDIEHYNINHLENETAGRTPAENAKRGFYRDGSLSDDQVEKMIYDSLPIGERYSTMYMETFDMKTPNGAGNALDDENKAKAFEVLKQAKEAYYKCSPLSQFFGLIFPTDANKCQKQIDFIRADLVKKGMTKEEIKMTENARLVAEPLFKDNNKPAKSNEIKVDAPKQENNKGKEHVNMSNEFGKGGLGEFDNSKKTESIDKNKDLSENKDLNNSKNDIKMDK